MQLNVSYGLFHTNTKMKCLTDKTILRTSRKLSNPTNPANSNNNTTYYY